MAGPDKLSLVVFSGGFERVHYALVMASAALASNRRVTLFFTGRALLALAGSDAAGRPGWHRLDPAEDGSPPAVRDAVFAERGVAGFEELLEACVALGATVMVCEMGLRAVGLDPADLRPDVPVVAGGVVTFLNDIPAGGTTLFV